MLAPAVGYERRLRDDDVIQDDDVSHNDVIKWKHFPRYWLFVRGIHRWPVNSPHKGQWRGDLICAWINGWVNNRKAGGLRRYRAHYGVIVMMNWKPLPCYKCTMAFSHVFSIQNLYHSNFVPIHVGSIYPHLSRWWLRDCQTPGFFCFFS